MIFHFNRFITRNNRTEKKNRKPLCVLTESRLTENEEVRAFNNP